MWRSIYKLLAWEYHGRKEQAEIEKTRWWKYQITQEIRTYTRKLKPATGYIQHNKPKQPLGLVVSGNERRQSTTNWYGACASKEQAEIETSRWRKYQTTQEIKSSKRILNSHQRSTPEALKPLRPDLTNCSADLEPMLLSGFLRNFSKDSKQASVAPSVTVPIRLYPRIMKWSHRRGIL